MKITKNSNCSSSFLIPQSIQPKNSYLYNNSFHNYIANQKMVYFPKHKFLSKSLANDSVRPKQIKTIALNRSPISLYYHHPKEHFLTPKLSKTIIRSNSVREDSIFIKKTCEIKNKSSNKLNNILTKNEEEKTNIIIDSYNNKPKEINKLNFDDYIIKDLNRNNDTKQNIIIEDINNLDNNNEEAKINNKVFQKPEMIKYGIDCNANSFDIKEYLSNNENKNKRIGYMTEDKGKISKNIFNDLNENIINKINDKEYCYQDKNKYLIIKDSLIQNPQLKIYGHNDLINKNRENLMDVWKERYGNNKKYKNGNLYENNFIQISNRYKGRDQQDNTYNNNKVNIKNIILNKPQSQLQPKPVLEINKKYNNYNENDNLNVNVKFNKKVSFMETEDKPEEKNVMPLKANKNKSFVKLNNQNPLISNNRRFIDIKTKINPELKVVGCDLSNYYEVNGIRESNNTINTSKSKIPKNDDIIRNIKTRNILNRNNYIKLIPTIKTSALRTQTNKKNKNHSRKYLNNIIIRNNNSYLYKNYTCNLNTSKVRTKETSPILRDKQNCCAIKTNTISNTMTDGSTSSSYAKFNTINNRYIINNDCEKW